MTTMVDVKTAARLMNLSVWSIRNKINDGQLTALEKSSAFGGGDRGVVFSIPLSSLPIEAQLKYAITHAPHKCHDVDLVSYKARYGDEGIAELHARFLAVQECLLMDGQFGNVLERKQAIADRCGMSLRRLYEWTQAYKDQGISGLMHLTKRKDVGKTRTMCKMAQDIVVSEYCASSQVSQNRILINLQKMAEGLGANACDVCAHNPCALYRQEMLAQGVVDDQDPCDMPGQGMLVPENRHSLNRFVQTIPEGVKAAGRKGWAYWEARYQPKAIREKPSRVNEVWFGDHHVFDIFVLHEGKPVRPWLTAWMDAASNALVGWTLSFCPNSDTIVEALTSGITHTVGSPFCGIPEMLYIDNGKDYRCKRLEGTTLQPHEVGKLNIDFEQQNALLHLLGIDVTHAIPYRAWSKTIERIFGIIETQWIRQLPGWCGNGIDARPETLLRDIRAGRLMDYKEFAAYWANVILPEYHAYKSESASQSPLEIYASLEKVSEDVPSHAMLAIAKMQRVERTVQTTGIRWQNEWYWDAALAEYVGCKVLVLYNRQDDSSLTILHNNEFICEAVKRERMQLVGEDEEKLQAHLREQRSAKRGIREALILPQKRVKQIENMITESPNLAMPGSISSIIHERTYRAQQAAKEQNHDTQDRLDRQAGQRVKDRWRKAGAALLEAKAE